MSSLISRTAGGLGLLFVTLALATNVGLAVNVTVLFVLFIMFGRRGGRE